MAETSLQVHLFSRSISRLKEFKELLYDSWVSKYPVDFLGKDFATYEHHKFSITKSTCSKKKKHSSDESTIVAEGEVAKMISYERNQTWCSVLEYIRNSEEVVKLIPEVESSSTEGLSEGI